MTPCLVSKEIDVPRVRGARGARADVNDAAVDNRRNVDHLGDLSQRLRCVT
jgi:hypothetical protein